MRDDQGVKGWVLFNEMSLIRLNLLLGLVGALSALTSVFINTCIFLIAGKFLIMLSSFDTCCFFRLKKQFFLIFLYIIL